MAVLQGAVTKINYNDTKYIIIILITFDKGYKIKVILIITITIDTKSR